MALGDTRTFDARELGGLGGAAAAAAAVRMTVVYQDDFTVSEGDRDINTGFDVEPGDMLEFSASGSIWAGVWLTGNNGPQGWDNIDNSNKFPLPGTHPFSLLGKLDGRYFYIGRGFKRVYQGRGSRLYLRINDDSPGNGNGAFQCAITVWRRA